MASSSWRMNEALRTLAVALLLLATLSHDSVKAQEEEEEVVTGPTPPVETMPFIRGDMVEPEATTQESEPVTHSVQVIVYPSVYDVDILLGLNHDLDVDVDTAGQDVTAPPAPEEEEPARGDEPETLPPSNVHTPGQDVIVTEGDVMCVDKEKVQNRDAVSLTLRTTSTCGETRVKIASVLEHLCGEDCKLDLYQEDNSNQLLISRPTIDGDAKGMAEKFNNDNIKDKVEVEDASPRWGKSSRMVLVTLLLVGLLLAALLVAGYYLKTHRGKTAKGVRLAESFQVDEENQANTLVSVAPLHPQEPLDKPTVNGESAPEDGKNQTPPTNGHSATQTPVADTEM